MLSEFLSGLTAFEPEDDYEVDHDTVLVMQDGKLVDITADKEGEASDT